MGKIYKKRQKKVKNQISPSVSWKDKITGFHVHTLIETLMSFIALKKEFVSLNCSILQYYFYSAVLP